MVAVPGVTYGMIVVVVSGCGSGTVTSAPVVTDVTDVLVSPCSVVTKVCDDFLLGSDREFVEPQSFSFSKKRAHFWTAAQKR